MIWRSNWRCLTRLYKAAAADSKCGSSLRSSLALSRQFGDKAATEPDLNRDFLTRLWMADREMERIRRKMRGKAVKQPPLSQSISEYLDPESPEEVHFFTTLGLENSSLCLVSVTWKFLTCALCFSGPGDASSC